MKKKTGKLALVVVLMLAFSMMFATFGVLATDGEPAQDTQNQEQDQQNNGNQESQLKVQSEQSFEFDILFTDTAVNVSMNNTRILDDQQGRPTAFNGNVNVDGTTEQSGTNTLQFAVAAGEKNVTKYTINGVEYNAESRDVRVVDHDWFITVPGAAKYTIRATGEGPVMYTIIWGNPGATDVDARDALIGHGNARVIAVYNEHGDPVPERVYAQYPGGVHDGNGWVQAQKDWRVVFEFVPEYGYQLTHIAINDMPLTPQETTNQFSFLMPERNVHFSATFTKTDDVVNTGTASVRGGTVNVANNLDGGTARLTVNNAELSADKRQGFQNAAGAYSVSQYLDIDLYNVFYKGKNDASDVWSNEIDELKEDATISLQLAEGVNANDIVLVHNIHDGEDFEIIPVDSYDPATNTITFKTKSFSNYAIATKDGKKGGSKGPGTGDDNNIIPDLVIMITAGLALAGIGLKRRYDR